MFSTSSNQQSSKTIAAPPNNSLDPYTGPWTIREASHLMRRATFGPTQQMISDTLSMGLDATMDTLLDSAIPNPPPLRYTLDNRRPGSPHLRVLQDPNVPYGETWVNEPPIVDTGDQELNQRIQATRANAVLAWKFDHLMTPSLNIMSKMWVFWHNHFVVSDFQLGLESYQYAHLLEKFAVGNFRELTKEMTILPAMLRYLNGAENIRQAPNENYARELLELFTVGKGELAGPGDYTTFTEDDVIEIAKVLTGWTISRIRLTESLESEFFASRHDRGDKQLSPRFGNAVITNGGDQEYAQLIDIIFEQDEVSRFISRKLYRYFVYSDITDEIEQTIIEPLAQIIRDNDYNMAPAIAALLSSEHFYSEEAIGCMIKNPVDFITSATKGFNLVMPDDVAEKYFLALVFYILASEQEMTLFQHPDVAGWKAYYQEPQYYRYWINSFTLPKRNSSTASIIGGGQISFFNERIEIPQLIDVITYSSTIEGIYDPNDFIYGIAANIFPYQISDSQKNYIKEILIPGLPDYEWGIELSEFIANPDDPQLLDAMNRKLVALLSAMAEMPEFQLM